MFERLKNALGVGSTKVEADEALAQWATERMLTYRALGGGGCALEGRVLDRPFRAGCTASSRSYIRGMELMARAELGLRPDVHVIVMNRALKRSLEALAHTLYGEVTGTLQTTDKPLPEEVGWMSAYRDAGWPGPPADFWAQHAVLTDAPEAARQWLDEESIALLRDAPDQLHADTPRLFWLTRGKAYLRMQLDQPGDNASALYALDVFEHLSARALRLFAR